MQTDANSGIQRILAVDDNEQTLQIVKLTLERDGYQVMTATSGQEALTVIRRMGLPHLALVDLNMPMMNGFEFCKALHEFSDVPVIMLTAINEEDTIVKGIEMYAEDYVVKPFRPNELLVDQQFEKGCGDDLVAVDAGVDVVDQPPGARQATGRLVFEQLADVEQLETLASRRLCDDFVHRLQHSQGADIFVLGLQEVNSCFFGQAHFQETAGQQEVSVRVAFIDGQGLPKQTNFRIEAMPL